MVFEFKDQHPVIREYDDVWPPPALSGQLVFECDGPVLHFWVFTDQHTQRLLQHAVAVGPGTHLPCLWLFTSEMVMMGTQPLAPLGDGLLQEGVSAQGIHIR